MRDALANVLGEPDDDITVDQVLAAAFFRKRPLQAGTAPCGGTSGQHVIRLADFAEKRGLRR